MDEETTKAYKEVFALFVGPVLDYYDGGWSLLAVPILALLPWLRRIFGLIWICWIVHMLWSANPWCFMVTGQERRW